MAITIDLAALGDGTYTVEDDGTPGNGTSVVRDPFGNIVATFAHPADALTILSRAGQNLNINITDSLTTASFTVGSIDNAFAGDRPDHIQIGGVLTSGAVMLSAHQTINEWGSDGATDIIAGSLLMRAGTGIGTGGNFIETQVSALEAESVTGGIALANVNDVVLSVAGAAGDLLRGLWTGTSGNVTLINHGSILLSDINGVESVRSAGNLQLTAIGSSSNISSSVNRDALLAVGNITLAAGQDILFGTVGTDFDNDVRAGGGITITAGRDFHIDGFSDMAADDQGLNSNGGISITTGRNILIEDNNGLDASVGISAVGGTGSVVLTTGVGGTLSLAANSSAAIQGRNGGVTVNADRILVENDSGINVSGTGSLRLAGASAGRLIELGSATDGLTAVELSDTELDRMVAQNVIIGSANSGQVTVVGAITHANPNLTIESGTDLIVQADITLSGTLTLRGAEDVIQTAASTISAGTLNVLVDAPDLDGPGGANTFGGALTLATGTVHGASDADTLRGFEGLDLIVRGYAGADTIISTGEGHYYGDQGNDTILAGLSSGAVPEVLDGGIGIDTLDTRTFNGDYIINLATGATNYGYESFVNFENVITGDGNDTVVGAGGANNIVTGQGNDILDGAAGADTLNGGLGNDRYYVDNAGDTVIEAVAGGNDIVLTSVNYVLNAGATVESLGTTDVAGVGAINITGNEFNNVIVGNAGANILTGGGGADTMQGLGGDDRYYVDNALDRAIEVAGAGNDILLTSVDFVLEAGSSIESLSASLQAGSDPIDITGNELANTIVGNQGVNILDGGGGADKLQGLGGDDRYYIDNAGDQVFEAAGGGNDILLTNVDYVLSPSAHVESLTTRNQAGVEAIDITANDIANTLVGNAGANVLLALGGNDLVQGLGGNDLLYGSLGNDRLFGGAGADQYVFDAPLDAATNVDKLEDYVAADDVIVLDRSAFTGIAVNGTLAASAFVTGAAAADADDRIIYNSAAGQIFYDADGSGAGAQILFATIAPGTALTNVEFVAIA